MVVVNHGFIRQGKVSLQSTVNGRLSDLAILTGERSARPNQDMHPINSHGSALIPYTDKPT